MRASIQVHMTSEGSAASLRVMLVLALALASCGIETDGGPGKDDAGAGGSDAGSSADSGSGGGGSGSGGEGGSAGSVSGMGGSGGSGEGGSGTSGDGGSAGAGSGGSSAGCDESRSPKDEPCLLSDERAVFVSEDGTSTADGTMAEPLSSVRLAVQKAVQSGIGRVIVCEGRYTESLVIEDAVRVYGRFSCEGSVWEPGGGLTLVQPSGVGEALRIEDVQDAVVIEDMTFVSRAATAAGGSSIAAVVVGSDEVTLRAVTLEAGAGKAGEAGETQDFEFPSTGAVGDLCADASVMCLAGKPADGDGGGAPREYTCPAGDETTGGLGGDNAGGGAQPGDPGLPDLGAGAGGMATTAPDPCSGGQDGAEGPDGDSGEGASSRGEISGGAWSPHPGEDGSPGEVGQGGGGAGGRDPSGGGGGGGGGGCGGAGGSAGQGGGASIALLSLDSEVMLEDCLVRANDGADGGSGSEGQAGMDSGGLGGMGAAGSCAGGAGGAGGKGGAGGGGAGGISAGIVWTDTEPTVDDDTTFDLGSPGDGGEGGDDSSTDDDGIDGVAVDVLEG